ncbi:hypothetical protein Asppvi_000018 [Aspergillus pseudoviridinutans]|uniref:Uncharacterized protein n=1 Tax=Aspergillus pseudoviridinutans TaxID=1517512 RepID=A0A9P3ENZ5_9EURO|nr:uncharacterized protein Asppvi_000018 [Aspergillus pseudoviridinutans]GIJ81519.1 hypothetical protein Asppvi_000018 [Aspergillus pseudoviridinutans]
MYLTKLISFALVATIATAAAAPFQLEERQSNACQQALAELNQASSYYTSVAAKWNGDAAAALRNGIQRLQSAASSINQVCSQMDQAISHSGQA